MLGNIFGSCLEIFSDEIILLHNTAIQLSCQLRWKCFILKLYEYDPQETNEH